MMRRLCLFLTAAVCAAVLLYAPADAQNIKSVSEINYNLKKYEGEMVRVQGYFNLSQEAPELWETLGDMWRDDRFNWIKHIELQKGGALPDDLKELQNALLLVSGKVSITEYEYAHLGDELRIARLTVESYQVIEKGFPPPWEDKGNVQGASGEIMDGECDSCKFAIIFNGYRQDDYWNNVTQKYDYKKDKHNVCPGHIVVLNKGGTQDAAEIPNGTADADGNLTSGGCFEASSDNLKKAFEYIKNKMKELECEPAEFQFHSTGHGGGYHGAGYQKPPDSLAEGIIGGRLDEDGDEHENRTNENDVIFKSVGSYDLDKDGTVDFKVELVPDPRDPTKNIKKVTQDKDGDGTFETTVGHDFNGDDRVSKADSAWSAPDINNNGTADSVGWDDVISIDGGDAIVDDELRGLIQELIDSTGLSKNNSRVEMAQCFGGSFLDDLKSVTGEASSAARRDEYGYSFRGVNGYSIYQKYFIDSLAAGHSWSDAHKMASDSAKSILDKWDLVQNGQYNDNTGECIEVIGPYEKDGKICIRVRNICGQTITVRPRLNTHNFGIQSSKVAEQNWGEITLKNGEWRELCIDKPTDEGRYCFHGFVSTFEPEYKYKSEWLNGVIVEASPDADRIAVNFEAGGNEEFDGDYIFLEPIPLDIPEGWEYQITPLEIEIIDFEPVPVEVVFFPPDDVKPGDAAELKIQGWAELSDPDAGHVEIKVEIKEEGPEEYVMTAFDGWNLSSLPAYPALPLLKELFPEMTAAFGFSSADGYYPLEEVNPPMGFWLNLEQGGEYKIPGEPIEMFNLDLPQGWHLIGGLSEKPAVAMPGGDCEIAAQFCYNPETGYMPCDMIPPGQSVWLNLPQDCNIQVIPAEGRKNPGILAASLWQTTIYAQGEQDGNKVNVSHAVLGADETAEMTMPAPPAPPEYTTDVRLYRFDAQGNPVQPSYYKDVQKASGGQTDTLRWLLQVDPNGNDPFQSRTSVLSWDPISLDGGKDNEQWLVSEGLNPSGLGNAPQDMKQQASLQVSGTDAKFYTVVYTYSQASSVDEQDSDTGILALGEAVPNPFNENIEIHYKLNSPAKLTAVIYNSYGREIWSHDAGFASGPGIIVWNGKNSFGRNVSDGTYYLQLNAGGKVSKVKIITKMK